MKKKEKSKNNVVHLNKFLAKNPDVKKRMLVVIEDHPEDVIDVDPEIIESMNRRLKEMKPSKKPHTLPWWERD